MLTQLKRPQFSLAVLGIIFFGFLALPYSSPESPWEFSLEQALSHIEFKAQHPHPIGSPHHAQLRQYLLQTLEDTGLVVYLQEGNYIKPGLMAPIGNVIAKIPGERPQEILITAHYDSTPESHGAVDNGTGIAALLEAARVLSATKPQYTLVFVALDAEEVGLLGARFFLENYPEIHQVCFVINFDTIASGAQVIPARFSGDQSLAARAYMASTKRPVLSQLGKAFIAASGVGTDFQVFADHGLTGIDLSSKGQPQYADTPLDQFAIINPVAVETVGRALMNLITTLDRMDLTRPRQQTVAAFTIGGRGILLPLWINGFVYLIALVTAIMGLRRIWPARFLLWPLICPPVVGAIVATLGLGVSSLILGVRQPWTAYPLVYVGLSLTLFTLGAITALTRMRPTSPKERLSLTILTWALASLPVQILMPEISHLFYIPLFLLGLGAFLGETLLDRALLLLLLLVGFLGTWLGVLSDLIYVASELLSHHMISILALTWGLIWFLFLTPVWGGLRRGLAVATLTLILITTATGCLIPSYSPLRPRSITVVVQQGEGPSQISIRSSEPLPDLGLPVHGRKRVYQEIHLDQALLTVEARQEVTPGPRETVRVQARLQYLKEPTRVNLRILASPGLELLDSALPLLPDDGGYYVNLLGAPDQIEFTVAIHQASNLRWFVDASFAGEIPSLNLGLTPPPDVCLEYRYYSRAWPILRQD